MKNKKYDELKTNGEAPIPCDKKTRKIKNMLVALRHTGKEEIASDVLGSYTGTPEDGLCPEQDADDL